MTLDLFEGRADIWRGGLTPTKKAHSIKTGFAQLDQKLACGGWPIGAITEILCADDGMPPLWLVMPALSKLSHQPAWITWVAPPLTPYAPALHALGIELSRVMLVHARSRHSHSKNNNDKHMHHWAIEQALKSGTASAVLGWLNNDNPKVLRRFQLAAESGNAVGFIFRPKRYSQQQSCAALRLCIDLHPRGLSVRILKCRGGFSNTDKPIHILFDQLPTYPPKRPPNKHLLRENSSRVQSSQGGSSSELCNAAPEKNKETERNPEKSTRSMPMHSPSKLTNSLMHSHTHSGESTKNPIPASVKDYASPRPYVTQGKSKTKSGTTRYTEPLFGQRLNREQTIDGEKVIAAAYKGINKTSRCNDSEQYEPSPYINPSSNPSSNPNLNPDFYPRIKLKATPAVSPQKYYIPREPTLQPIL